MWQQLALVTENALADFFYQKWFIKEKPPVFHPEFHFGITSLKIGKPSDL